MLLETLGGACLSPLVQVLLDRLAVPLIINFFQNRDFDETLLERLKTVLLTVNAVISDAEESEITNLVVKDWVNELKDAVYDADDLSCEIQTIALYCQLEDAKVNRDQVRGQFSAHHPSYEDIKSKLSNNEDIESRLEKIVKRLESLSKKIDLLNLKRSVARKPPIMLPSTSLVDESEVFGRGKDKEELLKSLLAGTVAENRIPVIAIVGIGGVGKTTLAQLLYNDSRVKGHFSLRAWAHVSEEFDVYKVTKIIFESVTSKICNLTDLNILQVRLKEVLTGMRFLLVLDDIWNGNFIDWDFMLSPLKAGHCSSRIIVTTRNQNVASTMKPLLTYRLPHLSDEACWELFAKHAFRSSTPEEHLILKRIGEDIVKKCKGLPLAAKTLGGLLHPEVEAEEWHAILNSKIWDLPKDKSSILPSLLLSYYDLPPHLKRCFAYCSIIPKGFEFEKEKLILMWMAEELLPQPMDKDKMEDVGVIYFHELVSRSFFQLSHDNQCFVMHDLVNDLAQFVSGEFCCKFEYGKPCGISEKTRHLSFLMDQINGPEKFVDLQELKSLRTFLPLSSSNPSNYPALSNIVCNLWLKFPKHLRALSFAYQAITELPDLKSLVHLRYLDLSHTSIAVKSGWKCPLYNLQTLLLSSCHKLTELPANIGELINLRYLDVSGTNLKKMPLEFGRLKGLRVLSNFVLSTDGGSKINELEELSHLCRKLSISKLEYVDNATDASKANLKGKNYLKELVFQWNSDIHKVQTEVLNNLQPHENLKKLTIENYSGTRFPNWLGDVTFVNMVFLRLTRCKKCTLLPPLGQLSSLQELYISNMEDLKRLDSGFYGNCHFGAKPFRSLRTLLLEDLPQWTHWTPPANEDGLFPSLQELQIRQCPLLIESLPKNLQSLTKLVISGCNKLQASVQRAPTLEEMKLHGLDDLKTLAVELLEGSSCFKRLEIVNCPSLSSFPGGDSLTAITSISISDCRNLEIVLLPESNVLERLHIAKSCDSLKSLSLSFFTKLQYLHIEDCTNLECLSIQDVALEFLKEMEIKDCPRLESLPNGGLNNCLPCLQNLELSNCPKLSQFSEGSLPIKLQSLSITDCNNLTPKKEWGLQGMVSLTSFEIEGGCSELEFFPEEGLLPNSLTSLCISKLPNLKSLFKGISDLTSLETLNIYSCENLKALPAEGLPTALSFLFIDQCALLGPLCQEGGRDRHKISQKTEVYIS